MGQVGESTRWKVRVQGAVQGVGFRPFVYRLAHELHLGGWVLNSSEGVVIELEGLDDDLNTFLLSLELEKPPNAILQSVDVTLRAPIGETSFRILESEGGVKSTLILPDLATCPQCLEEVFDPENRRYRYPFTNCTHCGPRFTIVESLPYDRPNTSMKGFTLCPVCKQEYENPLDRRFHAQPNACPACGPHLEFWDNRGTAHAFRDEALQMAAEHLKQGKIVALKGLGGFQLLVDARDDAAVRELRRRKHREEKPFAVMVRDLEMAGSIVDLSPEAEAVLTSQAAPIVLLEKINRDKSDNAIQLSSSVAPGNPRIGVMLPTTPLHHLLLHELGFPVVATSGNLSDEPICIDEHDALERLGSITNSFLVHNRPIVRHVDDSVVQMVDGGPQIIRRARGYAPLPLPLPKRTPTMLAVGGHLKNSVALSVGTNVFVSQHIGDLENDLAYDAFREVIKQFEGLYETPPEITLHDLHPDYLSSQYAAGRAGDKLAFQHHLAHVYACMGEHEVSDPVLGISWDGTGFGPDGTVWGGECLIVEGAEWKRFAALRTFPLPGGDRAVREPRRSALGLLYELYGAEAFDHLHLHGWDRTQDQTELSLLGKALEGGLNTPRTSSMGRLFDGVASLLGLRHVLSFEGQAAMELEWAVERSCSPTDLRLLEMREADRQPYAPDFWLDWQGLLEQLLEMVSSDEPVVRIASYFHEALAQSIVEIARKAELETVALTGGCFQNRTLTERSASLLRDAGFKPLIHRQIPPNDAGIAFGQIIGALHQKDGR